MQPSWDPFLVIIVWQCARRISTQTVPVRLQDRSKPHQNSPKAYETHDPADSVILEILKCKVKKLKTKSWIHTKS